MSMLPVRFHRAQHGVTVIELLVALAVFALFILMMDAVFSGARTNARKTEVAADVQQNARSAVYRMTRELRETDLNLTCPNLNPCLITGTDGNGQGQIVFKSARLVADNTVFCLYTQNTGAGYNAGCFQAYSSMYPAAVPPYSGTLPAPCNTTDIPCGSYTSFWQQYIGYSLTGPAGGPYTLYRVAVQLSPLPNQSLSLSMLTSILTTGQAIASSIQSFGVSVSSSGIVSVSIQGQGIGTVQGKALPAQQIVLPSQSMMRD